MTAGTAITPSPATVHAVADISPTAALFADPTRATMIAALADGRALPASVLANESGVAASTASEHLARLVAGGLLSVERSGRHRYYRLADERVAAVLEALALLAPQRPIRSLRASTQAATMRRARTCYDHLAGRLGVAVTGALLDRGALIRTDNIEGTGRTATDRLSAAVPVHPYRLGPNAQSVFASLRVPASALTDGASSGRPMLRFCVDWTEQRHHLAGGLGAALLAALVGSGWVRRLPSGRAVEVTESGRHRLATALGVGVLENYETTDTAT